MDQLLLAWALALKRRRARRVRPHERDLPVLFLFTDDRLPDPLSAVRRWPAGPIWRNLFGIVLRARDPSSRAQLARALGPFCQRNGVILLVAGDRPLAHRLGAGTHLARGRGAGGTRPRTLRSASVHGMAELVSARRRGATLSFVSPVFTTPSHPGARPLGTLGFARLACAARRLGLLPFALGGIDGRRARALSPALAGVGAIAALGP